MSSTNDKLAAELSEFRVLAESTLGYSMPPRGEPKISPQSLLDYAEDLSLCVTESEAQSQIERNPEMTRAFLEYLGDWARLAGAQNEEILPISQTIAVPFGVLSCVGCFALEYMRDTRPQEWKDARF